jgi:protoheme IX farnesyltransferase
MTRLFRRLSIATTASTLLLIAWGGVVRATGSGDGCPDWPRCFGRWIPGWEVHTLIEYLHRLLAATSSLLALALAAVAIVAVARRRDAAPRPALWLAVALGPAFLVQAALGGWVVRSGLDPSVVTVHFAVAFVVLAITVAITTLVVVPVAAGPFDRSFARLATVTALVTFAQLLVGTYVRAEGAGLAFRDWPLMGGRLLPSLSAPGATEMFLHRVLAIVVTALTLWLAIRARLIRPRSRRLDRLTAAAVGLVVAQVALGALNVVSGLAAVPQAGHVAVSAFLWAALVSVAILARLEASGRDPDLDPGADAPSVGARDASFPDSVRAYVALTKPRIIVLLLITTVPAMLLAEGGMPSVWLILATLAGGTLAAASANAVNMYLDRDIDELMRRTRQRPLPRHRIAPLHALRFGFVLGAVSFVFLASVVNVLAATLALAAIAFYVFVYTMWLKRTTTQNIVIGGAAGAAPVLVGWAAVTGGLAWPAWVLFAVVFVWTPPHFWALAIRVRDDYAIAGVPMLPVVKGEDATRRQIFLYALALFGTTLLLVPAVGMGPIYLTAAVGLGGTFTYRALVLWRWPSDDRAWRLFRFSIVYLGALFAAVALDALV